MSETVSWTAHEATQYGVRPCVIVNDRGRNLTVRIGQALVTIPRTSVYPTAHQALDEATRAQRVECARHLRYWRMKAQRQIEVAQEVDA